MRYLIVAAAVALGGCATSHTVMLADLTSHPVPKTAALMREDGNSEKMDKVVQDELKTNGIEVKQPLPAGTRQFPDVDVIVSYVDHWWWDVAMYLRSIDFNMFNAKTGTLLVQGHWQDSAFHGFRDPVQVVHEVVPDMLARLNTMAVDQKAAH